MIDYKHKNWNPGLTRRRMDIFDWLIVVGTVAFAGAIGAVIVLWTLNAEIKVMPREAHAEEVAEDPFKCAVVVCPPGEVPTETKMVASWYDYDLKGAPGYSKDHATAASRDFKRGTNLLVCRTDMTDACITVRVNDFGPDAGVHPDRGLDLSSYAFQQLAPLESGLVEVSVREVK
jgi:rare lipoprotein A (peptidoglycan hydrolase)